MIPYCYHFENLNLLYKFFGFFMKLCINKCSVLPMLYMLQVIIYQLNGTVFANKY